MTKKIVKRTDANNETLYFYTHSDAVDVGEGSSTKSLTEVIDDTLHKSAQTLTNAEKTQVYANLGLNGVDDVPTDNSNNVVRSGGVKAAIDDVIDDFTNRGFMYKGIAPASAPLGEDKTFYIAKSGDYTAYTGIGDGSFTLNGISVLTYATTTASGAWTKNDIVLFDDEPTAGSENLVKSGGVFKFVNPLNTRTSKLINRLYGTEHSVIDLDDIEQIGGYIYQDKYRKYSSISTHSYKIVEVQAGRKIKITANDSYSSEYALLKSYPTSIESDVTPVDYCDGTAASTIAAGGSLELVVPDDCAYIYVRVNRSSNNTEVTSIEYIEEKGDIPSIEEQVNTFDTSIETLTKTVNDVTEEIHEDIDLNTTERHKGYVYEDAWRTTSSNFMHIVIPLAAGSKVTCVGQDVTYVMAWALSEYNPVNGTPVTYADGYSSYVIIPKSTEVTFEFETGCYFVIQTIRSGTDVTPKSVIVTKDSVITEKIESNEYIAAINKATIDNKAEIDKLKEKETENKTDENFPVNPHILDTNTATVKTWDSNGDDTELVDGVSGEDFNVRQGDTRLTLTESCNINLEEWDAYEFVFKLSRPLSRSENVFIKLRNGNTELLNINLGAILRVSPYLNQLFRLRRAIKDITNYETISHTVDNVQLVFICSDPTFTLTMYGIRFIKTKPNVFISFDGGWAGVLDLALPVMTKYGIKGTAYVEIQYMTGEKTRADHMTAEQVRILDNNGWDVSNHSWHHRNWGPDSTYTDEECEEDMKYSRNWLLQNGFVRGANFYAAPHGVTNVSRTTIFDKYMKYYRAGGSADYDGFIFPCGSRLTANGRNNVIQYITFGGSSSAAAVLSKINSGINKGKSICINFHNIVNDKPEGETYDAEEFPIGEFTTLIQTLATMRDNGICYVLPNSVVWYGCHGAEVYDNIGGHAEMLGASGNIISLDANKDLETT